jgi:hypothetical protein
MNIDLNYICKNFQILGEFVSGEPYGSGHINDTFAVTLSQGGTPMRYILQRINESIFKNPIALMDNIKRVTEHQQKRIKSDNSRSALTVLPDLDGNPYFLDKENKYWRCYIFVENSTFILSGRVRDVTNIYINGEEIFLDSDSNFNKKLYLYKGQNKILIKLLTKGNKELVRFISVYRK